MSSFSSSFSTQALMDRSEAKPAERPVYHPYSLGTLALSEHHQSLESYSYSPTSSSLVKNSPGLPPCQPYKTAFSSSLTALGEYSGVTSTSLAPVGGGAGTGEGGAGDTLG